MSNKERCMQIITTFPEDYLASVFISLEAMRKMLDEALDDAYCKELYQSSFGDEDNDEGMPFEQFIKESGIVIE